MARRQKAKDQAEPKAAETGRTFAIPELPGRPSEAVIRKLLRKDAALTEDMNSINGERRQAIGDCKERHNLNTKAYAMVKKFHRMEAENAAELFYDFLDMMKSSGVLDKIQSVQNLPLGEPEENAGADAAADEEPDETTDAENEDDDPGNVRHAQFGRRQPVPETA